MRTRKEEDNRKGRRIVALLRLLNMKSRRGQMKKVTGATRIQVSRSSGLLSSDNTQKRVGGGG